MLSPHNLYILSANATNPRDGWFGELHTTFCDNTTFMEGTVIDVFAFTPLRNRHMHHVFDTQGKKKRDLHVPMPLRSHGRDSGGEHSFAHSVQVEMYLCFLRIQAWIKGIVVDVDEPLCLVIISPAGKVSHPKREATTKGRCLRDDAGITGIADSGAGEVNGTPASRH